MKGRKNEPGLTRSIRKEKGCQFRCKGTHTSRAGERKKKKKGSKTTALPSWEEGEGGKRTLGPRITLLKERREHTKRIGSDRGRLKEPPKKNQRENNIVD